MWQSASNAHLDEISGTLQSLRLGATPSRSRILTPNADEQEMKSYLLGTLDKDGRAQLEERFLSAPETYEELLIAEEELIDQYVSGDLSEVEQQQFETNFVITAERQTNLRFAQLLKRYVNSHSVQTAQKDRAAAAIPHVENSASANNSSTFSPSPASSRLTIVFCVTGVVLLGVVLLSWLAFKRPVAHSLQRRAERVVVVTLVPGSINTEGTTPQSVNVPPNGYNLKLELKLPNRGFRNYKSELFHENRSVQTSGELRIETKDEQYVVPLTITGEMLSPGDYEVKLSGVLDSGADELIEKYSFRVIE